VVSAHPVGMLRRLTPRGLGLPARVWRLECGALVNSIGGGFVLPFALIYFHDVRGFSLGTAG
jgi:hypothetical protein